MTRRVLLTGAGGQLGRDLAVAFADDDLLALDRTGLDITDRAAVSAAVDGHRPDVIVNAAAFTAVDACETDTDTAWAVNALGVRHVVEAADRFDARVVNIGTDYVFDGTATVPYTEWDATGPTSMYGRSKLGGERELRPGDLNVRVAWLCGRHGGNIVRTVLRLADQGTPLTFVDDQIGSPTLCDDAAALVRRLVDAEVGGTYHGANEGQVSWYEFVGDVLEAAGHSRDQVSPITTADLDPPRPAPRPAWSVLDGAALRLGGFDPQPHYRESLDRLVAGLRADAG